MATCGDIQKNMEKLRQDLGLAELIDAIAIHQYPFLDCAFEPFEECDGYLFVNYNPTKDIIVTKEETRLWDKEDCEWLYTKKAKRGEKDVIRLTFLSKKK